MRGGIWVSRRGAARCARDRPGSLHDENVSVGTQRSRSKISFGPLVGFDSLSGAGLDRCVARAASDPDPRLLGSRVAQVISMSVISVKGAEQQLITGLLITDY